MAVNSDFTKLDKGFNKIMKVGKTCFKVIATGAAVASAAVAAATAASIHVGSEFESAFAGVKKTVEATEEEYAQLRQSILDMTKEIPSSATEIAGVMEIAGQLGIATDSLSDFTEVMINLGVSTNMAAEEASTSLAKFANIMTMDNYGEDGISNYERLGSTIVDLGNNFATTEADIVSIGEALAASGKLAGMSEADIMGISAAMSSVGLTAEAGASSMSRLIMQMQQAVAEGSSDLAKYAEVAGMTGEQFQKSFRDDAAGTVVTFIEGLNAAGEDSYGILEDLELSTIRTRKAFLSLAGADELMANAVDMANEAWDENTALAIEAGKRYETAESKVQLMKNALSELGITAYEDLREPFVSVVEDITDKVQGLTDYVGGSDGISKWINNISTELPTLKRKIDNSGISELFDDLIGAGQWCIDNSGTITSVIVGIGSALAAYKIESTGSHFVNMLMSFGSLNPVTKGLLGVAAAIGVVAGAVSAYKQYKQELVDDNLAEHFGNIALSMEELENVAQRIIDSENISGVNEALKAFGDIDEISGSMEATVADLNKMNWKVAIGMELTEEEQDSYKQAIADYVASAQEYALQSQYAVSLNLKFVLGDSEEGQTIAGKVSQFYADSYAEMEAVGKQLSDAVNSGFEDGFLDVDEAAIISALQQKMADIQASLATGEFDANLSLLKMDYTAGGGLTAESFQNLQAELQDQVDVATQTYKDSYVKAVASINAANEAGKYLTDTEYQTALDTAQQNYMQSVSELQAKALNFQIETIMEQYADELDPAIQSYMDGIQQTLLDYQDRNWDGMDVTTIWSGMLREIAESSTLDSDTKGAISQLLDAMAPTVEQMEGMKQKFEETGQQIPKAILDGISNYDLLNAMTAEDGLFKPFSSEDMNSIASKIGEQMVSGGTFDGFYQNILNQLAEQDYYIPEGIADGVSNAAAELAATEVTSAAEAAVGPAADGAYNTTQSKLDSVFSQGFDAQTEFRIKLDPKITNLSDVSKYVSSKTSSLSSSLGIGKRAKGGLATRPELTWFAEEGPEMAIPIDGSKNAISLWEQTGRLLGMDSAFDGMELDAGSSPAIEYKPTLQFYGEAPSKSDIEDALRISQDEFETLMERYLKTRGRVSFG